MPDRRALDWLNRQEATQLFLSTPTIAEMSKGAEIFHVKTGSRRHGVFLERVLDIYADRIHDFDLASSRAFGVVIGQRQRIGRPIAVIDAMIAAIAIVHGATLATRNVRDFDGLDLRLVNPFEAEA